MLPIETAAPGQLLLSLDETAKRLSLSTKTVWSFARAGKIPSIKCGRRRMVPAAQLEQWIADELASQAADYSTATPERSQR